jgi:hypothetical protein
MNHNWAAIYPKDFQLSSYYFNLADIVLNSSFKKPQTDRIGLRLFTYTMQALPDNLVRGGEFRKAV